MAEENNKPRAGRRGGRARAQKTGGMLANLHGKTILVEKEIYEYDDDGGAHASSHMQAKKKSLSRQNNDGKSTPDDLSVESLRKVALVVSGVVKDEHSKPKRALKVSKSAQILDQNVIESFTPCAKQKKTNIMSTPPLTRRGGKENSFNNFSAADADQSSYVLSPAENSTPTPPMTSVKIADGKDGGNCNQFLSPLSLLSSVLSESESFFALDQDDDTDLCSNAQSGEMDDGSDTSGSRDSNELCDDGDEDGDDQESSTQSSEKSRPYAVIADLDSDSRSQSSVDNDNDGDYYESEDEDYLIDEKSSDSDDEFEFECDESEKEQGKKRAKRASSRGGCSGGKDDSKQPAQYEKRGNVYELPQTASTSQPEECKSTTSYILSDKDESAKYELSGWLTYVDREENECVYENDDESLLKADADSDEISHSPCDGEPEPQEIYPMHSPPTKSCISVMDTSSSVEPSTSEVIDLVNRLFHEVDKDTVTVKDFIKSVANHFNLQKVEKSLKKLIKSRLTVLIQDIEPERRKEDVSVPEPSYFMVRGADKVDGYDVDVVRCEVAEEITELASDDCYDEDGGNQNVSVEKVACTFGSPLDPHRPYDGRNEIACSTDTQNVSVEKVTCMFGALFDPHSTRDGQKEISSSTDAEVTSPLEEGRKNLSAKSKSLFTGNNFLSPKIAASVRGNATDDSMMSDTLFQNLSPDFSVKSKTPRGNQNDMMSMSNSFGDSIKSKILIEKGKWSLGSQIGVGSFGRVYTGLNAINGSE